MRLIEKLLIAGTLLTSALSAIAADTLVNGQRLLPNTALNSANGNWQLSMQGDGNLVLYRTIDWKAIWNTKTAGQLGAWLGMQSDGNLVLYSASTAPLWSAGTDYNPGAYLKLQDDGNLVVYSPSQAPLWATYTQQRNCNPNQHWLTTRYEYSWDWYQNGLDTKRWDWKLHASAQTYYGDASGPCDAYVAVDRLELRAKAWIKSRPPAAPGNPSGFDLPEINKVVFNASVISGYDDEKATLSSTNGEICGAKVRAIATKNGVTWSTTASDGCGDLATNY